MKKIFTSEEEHLDFAWKAIKYWIDQINPAHAKATSTESFTDNPSILKSLSLRELTDHLHIQPLDQKYDRDDHGFDIDQNGNQVKPISKSELSPKEKLHYPVEFQTDLTKKTSTIRPVLATPN